MRSSRATPLFLLAMLLLAGCMAGGKAPRDASSLDAALEDVTVETTATLGGIRGVVVDEAIRPVPNAAVNGTTGELSTTTGPEGTFSFERVEPGTYFFTVSGAGFLPVQAQAQVVAGEVITLRVQLLADLSPVPFHETFVKEGFIQYGASIATFAVNLFTEDLLNQSICNCYVRFDTGQGAVAIVIEATWESAIACPPGTADNLYWQIYEGDTEEIHIQSAHQGHPIYAVIDKNEAWDVNQTSFEASVTESVDCPRYNQQYKAFYTVWYLEFPPEGWSIVAGTA